MKTPSTKPHSGVDGNIAIVIVTLVIAYTLFVL